jgi:hypothetical protein
MLGIPHCIDNRLTDSGKVICPMHRLRSTPQKHYFSVSGTHFWLEAEWTPGPSAAGRLGKLKKFTSSGLDPATFLLVS